MSAWMHRPPQRAETALYSSCPGTVIKFTGYIIKTFGVRTFSSVKNFILQRS
jgi:hypothetical protein